MSTRNITVFYKWTAKPNQFGALKAIYQDVKNEMEANEPGALQMQCWLDEEQGALVVFDLFENGDALGMHLGTTAAGHFWQLGEIAVPGPFFFCGDVPEELKQAAIGMNMGAEFSTHAMGFVR